MQFKKFVQSKDSNFLLHLGEVFMKATEQARKRVEKHFNQWVQTKISENNTAYSGRAKVCVQR